jgi:CheY-like chemotaxis protein
MNSSVHILMVEDNHDDIIIMKDVLTKHEMADSVAVVRNGEEAINYVFKKKESVNVITPDLILLDLNLPRRNGIEVLQDIKGHADFCHLPIIVLTTSSSAEDIASCYKPQANAFITKPADAISLYNTIGDIKSFWFRTAQLPAKHV